MPPWQVGARAGDRVGARRALGEGRGRVPCTMRGESNVAGSVAHGVLTGASRAECPNGVMGLRSSCAPVACSGSLLARWARARRPGLGRLVCASRGYRSRGPAGREHRVTGRGAERLRDCSSDGVVPRRGRRSGRSGWRCARVAGSEGRAGEQARSVGRAGTARERGGARGTGKLIGREPREGGRRGEQRRGV